MSRIRQDCHWLPFADAQKSQVAMCVSLRLALRLATDVVEGGLVVGRHWPDRPVPFMRPSQSRCPRCGKQCEACFDPDGWETSEATGARPRLLLFDVRSGPCRREPATCAGSTPC